MGFAKRKYSGNTLERLEHSYNLQPSLQGFNGSRVDFLTIVFLEDPQFGQLPRLKPCEITKT